VVGMFGMEVLLVKKGDSDQIIFEDMND